jgi:hypothetical protein
MNRCTFLFVLTLTYIFQSCYSGTIDPNNNDSSYVEYGKHFSYVGKLEGTYFDGNCFVASAVAIDNNNILTAAHIVRNVKNVTVTFGNHSFVIEKFSAPKNFEPNGSGLADIAIGHSKKSFQLDFYPPLYTNADEIDKVCCICGFGGSGNFLTGVTFFDTKKRAGSNVIKYIHKDLLVCDPSDESANNRTSLEFLIANGDSGGGLFIDGKLAGINSCVLSSNKKAISTYKDNSGHTRVSNFIDWINENKFISSP